MSKRTYNDKYSKNIALYMARSYSEACQVIKDKIKEITGKAFEELLPSDLKGLEVNDFITAGVVFNKGGSYFKGTRAIIHYNIDDEVIGVELIDNNFMQRTGGLARMNSMSSKQRQALATKAAVARWKKV